MARRGLVSKGMGGPQSSGNAALMPKGEKPKGPELIPSAEVARRLRVRAEQVDSWISKGQLRGNDSGVRPYDFKKFQLDFAEDIRRAQKEALQAKVPTKSDRKPKKGGFFSKMASIFGGKSDDGGDSKALVRENERLKKELQQLRKSKSSKSGGSADSDQEEKIRYLEKQLSETRSLQAEVAQLKKQLKDSPGAAPQADQELAQELEATRRRLAEAERATAEAHQLKGALEDALRTREELEVTVAQLQQNSEGSADGEQLSHLQEELKRREHAFQELRAQAEELKAENSQLRQNPHNNDEGPLVEELLELHSLNLARFKRAQELYLEACEQLQSRDGASGDSQELEDLKERYEALLTQQQQDSDGPSQSEMLEQLSQARLALQQLKKENADLQAEVQRQSEDDSSERVKELEAEIKDLKARGSSLKLMETELSSLRKGMQSKENQIQKIAGRLADNEKRLAKAMQESARLTELLIERENRLRELSNEFEQEYRDKMENLDRQVSGLQWKLSLREERIASLESELLRKSE